ncbi:hypothetical protein Tco_1456611 [Tanacetum coccineum]
MPGNCHSVKRLYYCKTGTTLALGIKELKYDKDVEDMLNDGYDNGNMIDLFVEHYDYDVMGLINLEPSLEQNIEDSDCYSSDDAEEQIDGVDFQTKADDCVVIKDITTSDPFLNKLCNPLHKVKKGVVYLAFDPNIPWDKMEPLWDMKNDWRSVLVYCGRNDAEGRCAGKKGNKNRVMPNKDRTGVGNGEGSSKHVKKSKVRKVKKVKKKHVGNDSGEGTSQECQ